MTPIYLPRGFSHQVLMENFARAFAPQVPSCAEGPSPRAFEDILSRLKPFRRDTDALMDAAAIESVLGGHSPHDVLKFHRELFRGVRMPQGSMHRALMLTMDAQGWFERRNRAWCYLSDLRDFTCEAGFPLPNMTTKWDFLEPEKSIPKDLMALGWTEKAAQDFDAFRVKIGVEWKFARRILPLVRELNARGTTPPEQGAILKDLLQKNVFIQPLRRSHWASFNCPYRGFFDTEGETERIAPYLLDALQSAAGRDLFLVPEFAGTYLQRVDEPARSTRDFLDRFRHYKYFVKTFREGSAIRPPWRLTLPLLTTLFARVEMLQVDRLIAACEKLTTALDHARKQVDRFEWNDSSFIAPSDALAAFLTKVPAERVVEYVDHLHTWISLSAWGGEPISGIIDDLNQEISNLADNPLLLERRRQEGSDLVKKTDEREKPK